MGKFIRMDNIRSFLLKNDTISLIILYNKTIGDTHMSSEDFDLIENIPDESFNEDDLIEEIMSKDLSKEEIKKYLSLPIEEFAKLPREVQDACLVDELIEEFDNSDEIDKYHQRLFMRMVMRKYPSQFDRVCKYFKDYGDNKGIYGEKRYVHKYHKRNIPEDYELKAKFIFDNLKLDYKRYKNCFQERNGKKILMPVGMTYEELNELASNMYCLSNSLKNSELKQYKVLITERFIKGMSIRDYAKKYSISKGSVEHQTKKAVYMFAGLLARFNLAQVVFDEIFEEQLIDLQEIEDKIIKDKIFELIEQSGILNRL